MKRKNIEKRLENRIKGFEEGGRSGGKTGKIAANGFDMHKPGSFKK